MADAAKKQKSKPSGSANKAKKGKMTKAEKEKLKKEELERKAQEEDTSFNALDGGKKISANEEALRLQAIEEAKLKKREEASMAVEKVKLENEERRKRRTEMGELQDIITSIQYQLKNQSIARRNNARWARYMRCDGSPDPVNQGEINTYINLRVEDKTRNDSVSVLADTLLDLSLIDELQQLMNEEELSEQEINLHKETIEKLQMLISAKLDLATLQILCDATELQDQETNNLQHVIRNSQICLCVWGNIVKNPRIRSFEFQEIQFSFDIPRVLCLSDCAVRIMNTRFDHLSASSKALVPRLKKKDIPIPVEEVKPVVEEEIKEEAEKTEEKKEDDLIIPDLVIGLISPLEDEPKVEEEQEIEEVLEEDYPDPPTPEPAEYDDFDEEDDVVDLRAYDVLGGIYHFNLLHLPPQPKTVGSWTITQLVEPPELSTFDYVADYMVTPEDGKKEKEKKDEKPLIGVHMLLPADAVFLEAPTIARWDYDRKFWVTKGFSDQNLNETTRIFSFKISHFGTFCLLQDTHINMPFQSWELRPHKLNRCLFTITAAILELEIEIRDGLCCLSQPKERPELANIIDKWVTPQELIKMMKLAGVNVFPNEDSAKFVSLQNKDNSIKESFINKHPLIEDRLYQHMALTASAFAYTWSKWNAERNAGEIVFQAAEALDDEPLLEESWSLYMATKRRVTKLRSSEFDETLSQITDQDTSEYKSNLYHLVMDTASKPAQEIMQETSIHFIDCVTQLLKATKVLTYS
ncbi:dynein axonemal intermediate chain 7 homolog isoform X7 [Biomphalaria glabrata]|uniref:Dynein axonemal intermediate chain 7 homolog isoform X7 n=1 Tax=Biomphalaria glabrata TaxID=6526 RepID=A0A9W3BMF0_BIOGL|nr:dynein axonemal intermediate chain 7 homolog isoform X7 [Biomphalaria glabrata]